MKLIHRHIFANVALTCAAAVGLLGFVLMIGNALKDLLGYMLAGQIAPETFLKLLWLLVPFVVTYDGRLVGHRALRVWAGSGLVGSSGGCNRAMAPGLPVLVLNDAGCFARARARAGARLACSLPKNFLRSVRC